MQALAIENEYRNFDLTRNKLPARYQHVSGNRLQPLCRKLGIRYCEAVVGFEDYGYHKYSPVKDGVIVSRQSTPKLMTAIREREKRSEARRRRQEARLQEQHREQEARRQEQHRQRKERKQQTKAGMKWFRDNLIHDIAIDSAVNALFHLNRLAKKLTRGPQRESIYALKNNLVRELYERGYCDRVRLHETTLPERKCYACNGTGEEYSEVFGSDSFDDRCGNCDGTGVYADERVLQFVAFSFMVGGQRYCWHQPRRLVEFDFEECGDVTDFRFDHAGKEVPQPFSPTVAIETLKHSLRWLRNADVESE